MSSTVTENLVTEGKLLVEIAENGCSLEFDCDGNTLVETVQRYIESTSGISFNDQLLLCLDMKLDSNKPLSTYKLPSDDREVFLFNKARLQANSPPPSSEQVDTVEIADPPLPSSSHKHPLDDSPDPALKALPSYELQFRYHYYRGHAIYSRSQAKFETCEKLLREQQVQERALDVARANLDQYYRVMHQSCMDFMKYYSQQHRLHSDLLANFGRDIEKLRSCKLHPSLQTATRKCLLDFVKEENLRKWVENCSSSHRQFEAKVSQFQKMFADVKNKVEDLFTSKTSLPIRNLESTIKEHQRFINEQKSIMQSLSKDVSTVKKLVDDCLSSQLSSSLRPHDAVSALGPMYDIHDKNHMPTMQACDRSISKLLDFCKSKKNEMNNFVHSYMQKITYTTYIIKDARLQFPVFREAIARQNDLFQDLKLVRGIGPAYRACLAEVVRRKSSFKLYMGMAGQLAERLAVKRESEVTRREEFLKTHGLHIPRDILASMGLYDTPNQCDVNIAPFDTALLDIDISDVDYYAPEHLICSSLKSNKQGSSRGSFSMSNDSLHSAPYEENPGLDKSDLEELNEGCEFVEIAGTSKMEVENVKLRAELASKIALICSLSPDMEFASLDDAKLESVLKDAAEKTVAALHLKDEYGKHLQSMLKKKHEQCVSYEKRIQELEQRLEMTANQKFQLSTSKDASDLTHFSTKIDDCKSEILAEAETHMPYMSTTEPMEMVSCISNSVEAKMGLVSDQPSKSRESVDENMADYSGILNIQLDASMLESHHDEPNVSGNGEKDKMVQLQPLAMTLTNSSTADTGHQHENVIDSDKAVEPFPENKTSDDNVALQKVQNELAEKSTELNETESKLKAAMEEVTVLGRELEISRKLLDESQMNCAHLENCLHEAREEAQTHLCAADRRASEYSALRASAVKTRGLFERLRSCVLSAGGVQGFSESLRALSQSLANSSSENEDDGTAEFRQCIRVLADRVGILLKHRTELHEKYSNAEAVNEKLRKELEEKRELVKTLFTKHQIEKQANKEKISFVRFEVHEIAAFVLNSTGHYEAINRNGSNYYLSAESVALFTDHIPSQPSYIVGQIVHIERRTVKPLPTSTSTAMDQVEQLTTDMATERLALTPRSSANPYGLPSGSEYFVVTIAMLPDTTIHSPLLSS